MKKKYNFQIDKVKFLTISELYYFYLKANKICYLCLHNKVVYIYINYVTIRI